MASCRKRRSSTSARLVDIVKEALSACCEWVKALHVISVIAWMAGMLYLPRLFVYHADAEKGSVQSETFKVMERRLYRGITTPAMIATWVFGLLVFASGIVDWSQGWPWVKAVFGDRCSPAFTGFYGRHVAGFRRRPQYKPAEILPRDQRDAVRPVMIVIVIMVIVQAVLSATAFRREST